MFLILALTGSLIGSTQATQDDMTDDDFASYLRVHGDVSENYGQAAGRGCVNGGIGAAPSGFAALCIGCAVGAVSNVAEEFMFRERK